MDNQTRAKIFKEELTKLEEMKLIKQHDFIKMFTAYKKLQEYEEKQAVIPKADERVGDIDIVHAKPKLPIKTKVKHERKQKKEMSPEQVRERNITWSLILGVILLLIGGLVVATSNWEQMESFMKVSSIALVSLIFFLMSWVSGKLLKIEQTSFAFLTLGSLFVPIVILSAGYFHMLGDYLSLTGKGKYALGLLGSMISLPLYVRNAIRYQSRLFIWISYLFSTLTAGFLLAALKLPVDAFYLGIMIYNGAILFAYHKWKEHKRVLLFTRELPAYAQLNLIISTLLMLLFFESSLFYSFNVLLTAVIYISMVFVYNTKQYQFVFSALIAYGFYQFIEHSPLHAIDLLLYALVGFIYLGFQYYFKDYEQLRKMFQITSAVISFCAFIFISFQGLLIRAGEPSILLLLAYLCIALNYIYLSYIVKLRLFSYLAPTFIIVAGLQVWNVLHAKVGLDLFQFSMFVVGFLLFFSFFVMNTNKYLIPIRTSSFHVSILTMLLSLILAAYVDHVQLAFQLFGFGVVCYITYVKTTSIQIKKIAVWANPISWSLSLLVLYPELVLINEMYEQHFNMPFHLSVSGLLLFTIHFIWKFLKEEKFERATFLVAISTYSLGLLAILEAYHYVNEEFVIPSMLGVGIALYVLLVKKTKVRLFWALVSITSLALYVSLSHTFHINHGPALVTYLLFIPVALILIDQIAGRKNQELKPYFFYLAHLCQPLLILLALFFYIFDHLHLLSLFLPLVIYTFSTYISKREWEKRVFLYLTMTMIPILLTLFWEEFDLNSIVEDAYIFVISSSVMAIVWLLFNKAWRWRLDWYLISFSLVGVLTYPNILYPVSVIESVVGIGYIIVILYMLHQRNWILITIIPLVSSMIILEGMNVKESTMITSAILAFFILKEAGNRLFTKLFHFTKGSVHIDWYTVVATFYLVYATSFIYHDSVLWLKILPYLLFTYLLYSQVGRVHSPFADKIVITLTFISMLVPYYIIIDDLHYYIPTIVTAEIYALPWLAMTIGLSLKTWKSYNKVMNYIQLAILLIVTAYLIGDALISNTIWDAIIIGSLSLVSVLSGIHYEKKSYFFVGVGTLLLNVFIQTRPYWGNLPWWVYLLIAGFTLIGIASFTEWQKEKKNSDGNTILQVIWKKMKAKLKDWD